MQTAAQRSPAGGAPTTSPGRPRRTATCSVRGVVGVASCDICVHVSSLGRVLTLQSHELPVTLFLVLRMQSPPTRGATSPSSAACRLFSPRGPLVACPRQVLGCGVVCLSVHTHPSQTHPRCTVFLYLTVCGWKPNGACEKITNREVKRSQSLDT